MPAVCSLQAQPSVWNKGCMSSSTGSSMRSLRCRQGPVFAHLACAAPHALRVLSSRRRRPGSGHEGAHAAAAGRGGASGVRRRGAGRVRPQRRQPRGRHRWANIQKNHIYILTNMSCTAIRIAFPAHRSKVKKFSTGRVTMLVAQLWHADRRRAAPCSAWQDRAACLQAQSHRLPCCGPAHLRVPACT